MADITGSAHVAAPDVQIEKVADEFQIGRLFSGRTSVLRRRLLIFSVVSVIAYAPAILIWHWALAAGNTEEMNANNLAWLAVAGLLCWFAGTFAQTVICHSAYQHLCRLQGQPGRERSGLLAPFPDGHHSYELHGHIYVPCHDGFGGSGPDPVRHVGGHTFEPVTDMLRYGLAATIDNVVTLVACRDLRVAKEGPDVQRIATVFA